MSRASISAPASSSAYSVPPFAVVLLTAGAIMFVSGMVSALSAVATAVTAAYYVSTFVVLAMLWGAGYLTYRKRSGNDSRSSSNRSAGSRSARGGSTQRRSAGTSDRQGRYRRAIERYLQRALKPLVNGQRDRL